jgi:tRNA nucleotidyltransferase/poly(A) polymerase
MISYSPERMRKKILGDKYCRAIFSKRARWEMYVVGGFVRDSLRGVSTSDRDFVVRGDLQAFVREMREVIGGTVVQFKKDNMMRVVTGEGLTFDFSRLAGTIREDLSQRDFTINALGWSYDRGLIDYHNGLHDIQKKRVRALSLDNMLADPLRMIRAYRFAAELNGSIEQRTRVMIKTLSNKLKAVSTERITLEVFHLLNSEHASKYLKMALDDGLLSEIFSLSVGTLAHNIREVSKLEKGILQDLRYGIKVILNRTLSQNLTRKGLLCLATMLRNGSDWKAEAVNLRLSNRLRTHIKSMRRGMDEWDKRRPITPGGLFDIFMKSGDAAKDVLMLRGRYELSLEYDRFKRIWRGGLLSSDEIIEFARIRTGPEIGQIIEQVKRAQFEGKIRSKKQAEKLIKRVCSVS